MLQQTPLHFNNLELLLSSSVPNEYCASNEAVDHLPTRSHPCMHAYDACDGHRTCVCSGNGGSPELVVEVSPSRARAYLILWR
jgi:hypothetical protein